jgi:curved DNA-binding protein CbpA
VIHYTKEQREVANRVLKYSKMDYYAILYLKEDSSRYDIRKAYRYLLLLTHLDYNKFKDTKRAFRRELATSF